MALDMYACTPVNSSGDDVCRRSESWLAVQDGIDDHFKGKGAKSFSDNYVGWWEVFVREAAVAEVLFDSVALERLLNLVVTMARHNTTLTPARSTTSCLYRALAHDCSFVHENTLRYRWHLGSVKWLHTRKTVSDPIWSDRPISICI